MRTLGYLAIGAGVVILPYYFKRNGVWGAVLLGLTLVQIWQNLPPRKANETPHPKEAQGPSQA